MKNIILTGLCSAFVFYGVQGLASCPRETFAVETSASGAYMPGVDNEPYCANAAGDGSGCASFSNKDDVIIFCPNNVDVGTTGMNFASDLHGNKYACNLQYDNGNYASGGFGACSDPDKNVSKNCIRIW